MLSGNMRAWLPNVMTTANIAAGFCSILAAAQGRAEVAVYLLLLAIVFDILDGRLARWLRATSRFGQELDSLSDALSFCAAPAFLLFEAVLKPLGVAGAAVSLIFLLAGVLRLARFNVTSEVHEKDRKTLGVPTPIAAGYLMVLVLLREEVPLPAAVAVALLMALGMISTIRLPELKGRGAVSAMLLVGLVNYFAVVIWPNWYTVGWWNLWNVLILLAAHAEDRQLAATG